MKKTPKRKALVKGLKVNTGVKAGGWSSQHNRRVKVLVGPTTQHS
jgi:hypothetical protein